MSELVITVNGKKKNVAYSGNSRITVDRKEYESSLIYLDDKTYLLKIKNKMYEVCAGRLDNDRFSILINGCLFEIDVRSSLQERADKILQQKSSEHKKTEIKAPMPGMILKIKKNIKENIKQGETILILEAMKMENDLRASRPGILKEIFVQEGTAVEKGTVLFTIE